MRRTITLLICLLAASCTHANNYHLTILHTNDVHSRIYPIDDADQTCLPDKVTYHGCYGGVARRMTQINQIRSERENVLLLDAGDEFQGSAFYTFYRGQEASVFMNRMGYAAMAVGNHEFDDGPSVFAQFIRSTQFPVLSCNIDVTQDPDLNGLIKPYVVATVGGEKIGIIGYTTDETQILSAPGLYVQFLSIEESVAKAVHALKSQGIAKIIALSHSGFKRDIDVARSVDGISVIVAAHTNTYLSNTDPNAEGPYPVIEYSPNGEPVVIVSAYAYGKFLGDLEVEWDERNHLVSWQGRPILLDGTVTEDVDMRKLVDQMYAPLKRNREQIVGNVDVELEGRAEICRHYECSLGDIMADALLEETENFDTEIGLMNSGGIRAGLDEGPVTYGEVQEIFPFDNQLVVFKIPGRVLREALEHGASRAENPQNDGTGRFLQVSGMRYTWDPHKPAGSRILRVEVKSADGSWRPLDERRQYRVASLNFLRKGGDGFLMLYQGTEVIELSKTPRDMLIEYINRHPHVTVSLQGRISRAN